MSCRICDRGHYTRTRIIELEFDLQYISVFVCTLFRIYGYMDVHTRMRL